MSARGWQLRGFEGRSWHRLVSRVARGFASLAPASRVREARSEGGILFVLYGEAGVVRALHSLRGAVELPMWAGPSSLEACAASLDTRFAVAAEAGAIEELYERVGGRVHPGDDLWATLLIVLGAARELVDEGELAMVPAIARGVPLPPPEVVRRAWDHLVPDGHALVLALFEGVELETALVLRRRGAGVDLVLGPEALRRMVGPLGGDFRRDFRVVRAAVERDVAPVSCGVFAPTATLRELLMSDEVGGWARAMATRDVVIDPMPPWIAVAAGAGALRAVGRGARDVMAGIESLGLFGPFAKRARELGELVGSVDVRAMLGFNPLDVVGAILRGSRNANEPGDDDHEP